jgi:TRAP-type C4-dicarboxylate transport system substrate-binding protein
MSLPSDLREIFIQTVNDVCAENRKATEPWENENIEDAKSKGVEFFQLPPDDMELLKEQSKAVYEKYAEEINKLYPGDTYRPENYLKEVQDFLQ